MKLIKDKNSKKSKALEIFLWIIGGIVSIIIGILLLFLVMKLLMGTVQEIKPFW